MHPYVFSITEITSKRLKFPLATVGIPLFGLVWMECVEATWVMAVTSLILARLSTVKPDSWLIRFDQESNELNP